MKERDVVPEVCPDEFAKAVLAEFYVRLRRFIIENDRIFHFPTCGARKRTVDYSEMLPRIRKCDVQKIDLETAQSPSEEKVPSVKEKPAKSDDDENVG